MFDAKGVTGFTGTGYPDGALPVYVSTNNPLWTGHNVDGTQFPNTDDGLKSCSAAMPLVKADPLSPDAAVVSIGTVHSTNPVLKKVEVRPIRAWAPHYEEDIEFQACAPQAAPLLDPPLNFARDASTGNIAWCAESYPSQNDHVPALDRLKFTTLPPSAGNPYLGLVRPYTSHVAKHSASGECTRTLPSSIPTTTGVYPSASSGACTTAAVPTGLAGHPNNAVIDSYTDWTSTTTYSMPPGIEGSKKCANVTCDRTAIATGGPSWQAFPLLASPPWVEKAISTDTTYGCTITWDNGGTKSGKKSPGGGCCGAKVHMKTGFSNSVNRDYTNTSAHLEPDVPCDQPTYD
jgi:hypothetical protein